MPRALLGARSCRRCGTALAETAPCPRCGSPWAPAGAASPTATEGGPLDAVVRAARWRRHLATGLDVALPTLPAAWALAEATERGPHLLAWWVPALLALGLAVAEVAALGRTGATPGRLALGLRTVDDLTGAPVGAARAVALLVRGRLARRTLTADQAAGRDTRTLRLVPVELAAAGPGHHDGPGADTGLWTAPTGSGLDEARRSVGLVLEGGEHYEVRDALLVGRNPTDPEPGRHRPLLSWPDLSRRLARTHLLLEWSGTVLWVTDLGSATGTALVSGDDRRPLAPGVRSAAAVGTTIECGGRRIEVVPGG